MPLLIFLAGTRRAWSLGVADVGLAGFTTGAGFGLVEESVRAIVSSGGVFGALFGPSALPRSVGGLFPGDFDSFAGRVFGGHAVLTGLVALGVGFALRLAPRFGARAWLLPGGLLAWAVLDHAAFNGGSQLPGWLLGFHALLGAGSLARPLLLVAFVTAVVVDFRDLSRLGELPRLPGEARIDPVTEVVAQARAAVRGVAAWVRALHFIRLRHRLGFGLLAADRPRGPGDLRPPPPATPPSSSLDEHHRRLSAVLATAAIVSVALLAAALAPASPGDAYFANLLDGLARWWDGLSTYEKAAVIGAAALLFGIAGGGWIAAFNGAAFALEALDRADEAAALVRDPRAHLDEWRRQLRAMTPGEAVAYAGSVLADLGLRRIGAGRARSALTRQARQELARLDPDVLRLRRGTGSSGDAEILRQNREDILGISRPEGWETHHVIPSNHLRAAGLRDQLEELGIPVNHELNGIELPGPRADLDQAEALYHRTLHTEEYFRALERRLHGITDREEALEILRDIGERLARGLPPE